MIRQLVRSVVVMSCLALPIAGQVGSASAEGGTSIASASAVTYGTQEFGDLSKGGGDGQCDDPTSFAEYWLLPVSSGDRVTLDWEIDADFASGDYYSGGLFIYPVGTTDFNVGHQEYVTRSGPNSVGKNEVSFNATKTGNMILEFSSDQNGCGPTYPYDFTASIKHGVVLGLPHIKRVSAGRVVRIGVHHPGGTPIAGSQPTVKLEIQSDFKWKVIGTATTSNGVAVITESPKRSQRGLQVPLRAVSVAGGGYLAASSTTHDVTVA